MRFPDTSSVAEDSTATETVTSSVSKFCALAVIFSNPSTLSAGGAYIIIWAVHECSGVKVTNEMVAISQACNFGTT